MALVGVGPRILKRTVFAFNLLLCVWGLVLASVMGFLTLDSFLIGSDRVSGPSSVLVFLVVIAAAMMFLGGLGCFGSFWESEALLLTFVACLLVLFVCEVTTCGWVCRNGRSLTKETKAFYDSVYDMAEDQSAVASHVRWVFHEALNCYGKSPSANLASANLISDTFPQTGSLRTVSCHDRVKGLVHDPSHILVCYSVVFGVILFEMMCGLHLCLLCTTEGQPAVRQRGDEPGPGPRPRDV